MHSDGTAKDFQMIYDGETILPERRPERSWDGLSWYLLKKTIFPAAAAGFGR
jgi:hypothetical protein